MSEEKEILVSLKTLNIQEKHISEKKEFDRLRIELAERLEKSMLPAFKKELIERHNWSTCFVITSRNIGKTYNMALFSFSYMLRNSMDGTFLRIHKTRSKRTIVNTFTTAFEDALGLDYLEYLTFGKEKIRFQVGSFSIVLEIEGIADPNSIKGTESKFLWVDESQELSVDHFSKIQGSIRSIDGKHKIVYTSNIPIEGKKSWIYKNFVEPKEKNQEKSGFKYLYFSFEANFIAFPDKESIEIWIASQEDFYYGREGAFKREIFGEWLEQSEYNIIKNWRLIDNKNLEPNVFISIFESGTFFTLGMFIIDEQIAIVSEFFFLPKELKENQLLVHHENMDNIIENNSSLILHSVSYPSVRLEELASFFATRELLIEKSCLASTREIEIASFDVKDDDIYLIDKPLSKNTKGFTIRALQVFISWIS